MSGQPSAEDWAAYFFAAIALFAAFCVPYFLLVNAPLSPRRAVRALVRIARRQPAPRRLPLWARTGHLPTSPSTAAKGRHRRGGLSR